MMYCGQCGGQNQDGARFCSRCGSALNGQAGAGPAVETITPRVRTRVPDFVLRQLRPQEQILAAFKASLFDHHRRHDLRHDKVVLTTERIISYRTALIRKSMDEMPYRMITGVHYNRGLVHGKVIIDAANAGLTLSRIGNEDAAFAEKVIAGSIAGCRYHVA